MRTGALSGKLPSGGVVTGKHVGGKPGGFGGLWRGWQGDGLRSGLFVFEKHLAGQAMALQLFIEGPAG